MSVERREQLRDLDAPVVAVEEDNPWTDMDEEVTPWNDMDEEVGEMGYSPGSEATTGSPPGISLSWLTPAEFDGMDGLEAAARGQQFEDHFMLAEAAGGEKCPLCGSVHARAPPGPFSLRPPGRTVTAIESYIAQSACLTWKSSTLTPKITAWRGNSRRRPRSSLTCSRAAIVISSVVAMTCFSGGAEILVCGSSFALGRTGSAKNTVANAEGSLLQLWMRSRRCSSEDLEDI